jgi:hypothetical protein
MDEERLSAAILIIMEPWFYKVCEGCDSIVMQSTSICPSCKSYRFDSNEFNISNMAQQLANNDQKTVTEEDLY